MLYCWILSTYLHRWNLVCLLNQTYRAYDVDHFLPLEESIGHHYKFVIVLLVLRLLFHICLYVSTRMMVNVLIYVHALDKQVCIMRFTERWLQMAWNSIKEESK